MKCKPENKKHLLFSLLCYLQIPLLDFLEWTFKSDITTVRTRAGRFLGYHATGLDEERRFPPAVIFRLWHGFGEGKARKHLHEMIHSCAQEIALEESDAIIKDKTLKIKTSELTQDSFERLLTPDMLLEVYRNHAPFTWKVLETISASPNLYRKRKSAQPLGSEGGTEVEGLEDGEVDDGEDLEENPMEPARSEPVVDSVPDGFSRNPVHAALVAMSMLTFARNRATNALPLLCGLFFKIEGTSSRVLQMLSNLGVCTSVKTVERVKEVVSKNCIENARSLILEGDMFVTVFDNINLYLRKHQQRLTNQHTMIHATNCAIIRIHKAGVNVAEAIDMKAKLDRRGKRFNAKFTDILPSKDDDEHLRKACTNLIVEFIIRYTPGSERWKGRAEMLEKVREDMPRDRPIPVEKTDTRPFGVFDANEGSKKGIIELLDLIRSRTTMSPEEWAGKVRVLLGDWLTSNNFRHARSDRKDDVSPMERLEYGEEVSQLFHFALQATQMIIRTHFGTTIDDPVSLASHKGLLGRVWDPNVANYAAAKSLIRHSLIARILHITMTIKGYQRWSDLWSWRPTYDDVKAIAAEVWEKWATTASAEHAKAQKDDWAAHDIYFIRDALLFCEFEQAVSYADPGRVLRVMRYWCLAFRGAGQHNYARECAEILLRWKYELSDDLREVLERSWFVNRWGKDGQWIAADLYLEQLNLLVKRIFIAQGNGVTIEYIMSKGSACVEAFRAVSHTVANFFGDTDRRRRAKEVRFQEDMRVLVEDMERKWIHKGFKEHFVAMKDKNGEIAVPKASKAKKAKKKKRPQQPKSAIVDVMVTGAETWTHGKFNDFKRLTTYDPAIGYPIGQFNDHQDCRLDNGTVYDTPTTLHLTFDSPVDVLVDHFEDSGVGGGGEFDTGLETDL
ncbi:hypothetical protein DFP72DRAFT_813583 [Ephemerocybe angulata]|uniref:DUF6589 domain-containing protein n=1 Tax=Ephemerocybe angulata TaxID=980116 RepID=A0A8H6M3A8_9AGAR|nr:hypothetical protein DFP72DRAFT_813583 [Tulosesus angulatus]